MLEEYTSLEFDYVLFEKNFEKPEHEIPNPDFV